MPKYVAVTSNLRYSKSKTFDFGITLISNASHIDNIVRCEWNEWTAGTCSLTCGGGTRQNHRTEKISASHGGEKCQGPSSEEESCNNQPCPGY